jgi:chromosome partitioning protein
MAKILAMTNRKGGSGKTACSVNISAEFAARGQRVLLIDLDTQSHCAIGLGIALERSAPTIHGFMEGNNTLSQAICSSQWPGLDLVPGNPLADHGTRKYNETHLRDALCLPEISASYDWIVLDTAPSLDTLLINALRAADRVLVPFVPHYLGAEGVRQLSRLLFRIVSHGDNDNLNLLGFLPVMQDLRVGLHREMILSLSQQFGQERLLPGVRNDIRVAEAFAVGQPLRVFAPKCRGVADYAEVVDKMSLLWR